MPLPEGYVDPEDENNTLVEWFKKSDPFMKATLAGIGVGVGIGSGFYLITRNRRATYHVGWISYIASTAGLWLYYDTHNTRRLGTYEDK